MGDFPKTKTERSVCSFIFASRIDVHHENLLCLTLCQCNESFVGALIHLYEYFQVLALSFLLGSTFLSTRQRAYHFQLLSVN